jgi:hypothetical protein
LPAPPSPAAARPARLRHLDDPGAPVAWDGLGDAPTANDEPGQEKRPQKRKTARNREIILGR